MDTEVRLLRPSEVLAYATSIVSEGKRSVVLLDPWVQDLHDRLVAVVAESAAQGGLVVVRIHGEGVTDAESFFEECRRSIPSAGYMGSSLDALQDVLRFEALGGEREGGALWVWTGAHGLLLQDPLFFAEAYGILIDAARQAATGFVGPNGGVLAPWPGWAPRKVGILVTGAWGALKREASRPDAFLLRFPSSLRIFYPDLSTGVELIHVTQ